MYDLRWIRDHPDDFINGLTRRGLKTSAEQVLDLDKEWRTAETRAQEAQARRNRISKEIGAGRDRDGRGSAIGASIESGPLGAQPLLRRSRDELQGEARKAAEDARQASAEAARLRVEVDTLLEILP